MPQGHLRAYIDHYFAPHPSHEVRELFVSRAILDFAIGTVSFFEPIFLFRSGFSVPQILLFYAAIYALYLVLLPIGGRICRSRGNEHTMLLASPFLIMYYLCFYGTTYHAAFIAAAVVAAVLYKILYWPGYHANFAAWGQDKEQGREVANVTALVGLVNVLAPAFGGLVIVVFGFPALFVLAAILILVSNIPLLRTPEVRMPCPFPYFGAWRLLFARKNLRRLASFGGFGEEMIGVAIWPLYVATVVASAVGIGLVTSVAKFANVFSILYVGRVVDEEGDNKAAVVRSGALYTVLAWLARPFMTGVVGVTLSDSFYRISSQTVVVTLTAMNYEDSRNVGVMENVIFVEMALSLGKLSAALIIAALFWLWPGAWAAAFVIAAAFAYLYSLAQRPPTAVV